MAPSKDYWIRRAEELEKRAAEQGETLIRQALRHYKRAAQEISSQIEEFYGRYASEQGLSYAEAVKVLRGSEAKAWTKTLGPMWMRSMLCRMGPSRTVSRQSWMPGHTAAGSPAWML